MDSHEVVTKPWHRKPCWTAFPGFQFELEHSSDLLIFVVMEQLFEVAILNPYHWPVMRLDDPTPEFLGKLNLECK